MTEHSSVVGGSSAERVIACPGSVELCKPLPNIVGEAASRGSALHAVMEELLQADEDSDEYFPNFYLGKIYEFDGRKIEITQELIDTKINPALDWFDDLDPDYVWVEQKLSYGDHVPGGFGTADVIYKKEHESGMWIGGVIDWKFGDGHLVSANSTQNKFYTQAAIGMNFFKDCSIIKSHIFQPSTRYDDPAKYHIDHIWDLSELTQFEAQLSQAVLLAIKSDPPLNIGDHCKWCPAKQHNVCPAIKDLARTAEGTNVSGVDLDELAYWLDMADTLEGFVKDIRAKGHELAEAGTPPPGWKLVAGKGRSRYKDEAAAEGVLARAGIGKKDRTVTKLIGITAARKLLKEAEGGEKKLRLLEKHIEQPEGSPKLVRSDAPGEPVVNAAGAVQALAKQLQAKDLSR